MQSVCLSCFRLISAIRVWAMFLGLLWLVPRFAELGPLTAYAADRYVTPPGGYGTNNYPYTNWADAATNIQWAVDVATNGDTVWVTNGNYRLTNQIWFKLDSASTNVRLKSVNGRDVTFINGNYSDITNRCIAISNTYITIDGFTVSNGYAKSSGDDYAAYGGGIAGLKNYVTIINCAIRDNRASRYGGGVAMAIGLISNCIVEANQSVYFLESGGIGSLKAGRVPDIINCLVTRNMGGGISYITGDRFSSTIRNCVVAHNYTTSNNVGYSGVGIRCAYNTIVENCTIISNYYTGTAGNMDGGGLGVRGGVTNVQVYNCIIYSNGASSDWCTNNATNVTFYNNCTSTTNGMEGSGNITNWPMFVDYSATNYSLVANSPCVNRGTNQDWMTNAVDLDGRIRIRYGTVDMGAYERIYNGSIYSAH